jgi:CheY-like chemotaxis protein
LAEQIRGAGERAAALTRQLLAFSRQQLLHPKVLKLNDVIMKSVRLLERLIGEDVAMTTSLSSRLWSVKVDEGQMEQVLMNLAVNARDAMPQGGKLVFQTANVDVDECYAQVRSDLKPGPYVVLSVSDTGCGMDENTRARVFEPFFTTKEPGKGTGLGLATVFGIVKQSGGYVAVYSELGKGTVITIYLPKVETGTAPGKEDEPQPVPAFGMETVLLVEDSDMVRNVVCRSLRSQGYTVLEARDGIEALAIFQEHRGAIHLVLTDVVMPEMSGRQLSEQLLAWQPDLKMLFMSGFTDDSVVRHGVLTDETNFIQKPFSAASLTQKIREILDRPVQ